MFLRLRRPILAIVLWIASCIGSAQASDQQILSLSAAKRIAVENNYNVQALKRLYDAERVEVDVERSVFFPQIGVVGGYDFESRGDAERQVGVGYAYLRYNLFNGFADSYAAKTAELEVTAAKIELERAMFEVGLEVESLYHEYLRILAQVELFEGAIDRNQELVKISKRTRDQGLVSAADVLAFEIIHADLASQLHSLRNDLEESRIGLLRVMGSTAQEGVSPQGALPHFHLEKPLMEYLTQLRERSFPIRQSAITTELREHQWRQVRSGWLPKIDFEVATGFFPLDELEESEDFGTNMRVIATWELFSGLKTQRRESAEKKRLESAELRLKQDILDVISQAEVRYRRLKTIEDRIDLEAKNIKLSETYYNTVKKEYVRGYKTSSDLADAAQTMLDVRHQKIVFLEDFIQQRIQLERLTGVPVATVEGTEIHGKEQQQKSEPNMNKDN